jgi:hypothetical protein
MGSSYALTASTNTSAVPWLSGCNKGMHYVSPKDWMIRTGLDGVISQNTGTTSASMWHPQISAKPSVCRTTTVTAYRVVSGLNRTLNQLYSYFSRRDRSSLMAQTWVHVFCSVSLMATGGKRTDPGNLKFGHLIYFTFNLYFIFIFSLFLFYFWFFIFYFLFFIFYFLFFIFYFLFFYFLFFIFYFLLFYYFLFFIFYFFIFYFLFFIILLFFIFYYLLFIIFYFYLYLIFLFLLFVLCLFLLFYFTCFMYVYVLWSGCMLYTIICLHSVVAIATLHPPMMRSHHR